MSAAKDQKRKRKRTLLETLAGVQDPTPESKDIDDWDKSFDDADVKPSYNEAFETDGGATKSKLRAKQPLSVTQDARYQGSRVSRKNAGFDGLEDPDDASLEGSDSGASAEDDDLDAVDAVDDESGLSSEESDSDMEGGPAKFDDDEASRIQAEYAELEKDEVAVLKQSVKDPGEDAEKGKHVRCQLSLWDKLVEARIRLQPALALANRLPQNDNFETYHSESSEQFKLARNQCWDNMQASIKLQDALAAQNSGTASLFDSEDMRPSKQARVDDDEGEIMDVFLKRHTSLMTYVEEAVEKWYTRTNLARTKTNTKKFKALDQTVMQQVSKVMNDRDRLTKRSQLKRAKFDVIGKTMPAVASDEVAVTPIAGQDYDTEIFDDGDFYHELLRDFLDRKTKTTDMMGTVELGKHWLELSNLRAKVKRKVDTKASKGRKIRYTVHEKLVNFMAPDPNAYDESTTVAKDQLFSSLFQAL